MSLLWCALTVTEVGAKIGKLRWSGVIKSPDGATVCKASGSAESREFLPGPNCGYYVTPEQLKEIMQTPEAERHDKFREFCD